MIIALFTLFCVGNATINQALPLLSDWKMELTYPTSLRTKTDLINHPHQSGGSMPHHRIGQWKWWTLHFIRQTVNDTYYVTKICGQMGRSSINKTFVSSLLPLYICIIKFLSVFYSLCLFLKLGLIFFGWRCGSYLALKRPDFDSWFFLTLALYFVFIVY